MDNQALIRKLYKDFNQRDIAAILEVLDDAVTWANGMSGGYEHGREAVRAYWTKQWATIKPQVEPLQIVQRDSGAVAVGVHQVVHDVNGNLLLDEYVRHVFCLMNGRVTRFDIEQAGGLSALGHT